MNVLMVSEYYPPDQIGASTRISILVNELIKFHDITVITGFPHYPESKIKETSFFKPIKIFKKKHLKIIRIWMPVINMNSSLGRIIDYSFFTVISLLGLPFVSSKPDFIWGTSPNVFCGFTAKLAKKFCGGGVTIANVDDVWPEAPVELGFMKSNTFRWIGEILAKTSVKCVDGITPISDTISLYYKKKYKIQNIFTIPVGFDARKLDDFIQFSKEMENLSSRKNNGRITFMYSGIFGPAYDFELAIKSFASIKDNLNIELIIRGTGPLEKHIQGLMKKYRLKNARLETQYLSIEELHKKLFSADVFLLPMVDNFISKTALPTKLFEYMSIGKPILLYGRGEPKNLVEKANAGLICEGGGYQNFAECIKKMVDSPLKNEWGKNGQLYIKTHYSSKIIYNLVNEMFLELKKKR